MKDAIGHSLNPKGPGSSNVMLARIHSHNFGRRIKNRSIEASRADIAISAFQARNLIITDIKSAGSNQGQSESLGSLKFFNKVKHKDVVILSRQLATLLLRPK